MQINWLVSIWWKGHSYVNNFGDILFCVYSLEKYPLKINNWSTGTTYVDLFLLFSLLTLNRLCRSIFKTSKSFSRKYLLTLLIQFISCYLEKEIDWLMSIMALLHEHYWRFVWRKTIFYMLVAWKLLAFSLKKNHFLYAVFTKCLFYQLTSSIYEQCTLIYQSTQPVFTCFSSTIKTRIMCKICSKLAIETLEQRQWRHSGIFIVIFEQISHIALVFPTDLVEATKIKVQMQERQRWSISQIASFTCWIILPMWLALFF